MSYTASRPSERLLRLKERYKALTVPRETNAYAPKKYKPFRSGDRWVTLGYLRGYRDHADALTQRLRTSYAEAEELYQAKPIILEDELLLGHLYLPEYSESEQAEYDRLAEEFRMSAHTLIMRAPRKDHIGLDLAKLLRCGVSGLMREIIERRDALDLSSPALYPDCEALKQYEFYSCCLIELEALLDLAARYRDEALALAEAAEGARARELREMAEIIDRVPRLPAESFREAVQSIHFFLSTLFGLYPLGRPDRYLYPYFARDLAEGKITGEEAQELIDQLCLGISDRVFSRSACGFIVGGRDGEGHLTENELTYRFLSALDHLRLPDPNGALAVCSETSDDLLDYAWEILSHGTTHPAFYNDDAIPRALTEHYGVSRADASEYIHSTCAEISVIGASRPYTTPFLVDLPRELDCVILENPRAESISQILSLLSRRILGYLREKSLKHGLRMLEGARFGNEQMRICTLIGDCIARGKSIYEGGERYTFIQPIFVGFATALDSLLALEHLVYRERRLSLSRFAEIVASDFAGEEELRSYIISRLPHYGNGDPEADSLAAELAKLLTDTAQDESIPMSRMMMPGTFTYINHASMGSEMGATYDGRRAGFSYSDGCGAVQGRDVSGPTAMIRSLTSWDQSRLLGGMVVNFKLAKSTLGIEKRRSMRALVRTFIERGGIELQVNAVDRDTLLDAEKNPEAHRDLLVRIGGYSDYFVRLSHALREELIARTEH